MPRPGAWVPLGVDPDRPRRTVRVQLGEDDVDRFAFAGAQVFHLGVAAGRATGDHARQIVDTQPPHRRGRR